MADVGLCNTTADSFGGNETWERPAPPPDPWWFCQCGEPRPRKVTVGWMIDLTHHTCRCPKCA